MEKLSILASAATKGLNAKAGVSNTAPVLSHAIDTFGSQEAAEEWFSIECGALNKESPANFLRKTGDVAEVDRILGCIDYGMIA